MLQEQTFMPCRVPRDRIKEQRREREREGLLEEPNVMVAGTTDWQHPQVIVIDFGAPSSSQGRQADRKTGR